jgi:hypothetical protein
MEEAVDNAAKQLHPCANDRLLRVSAALIQLANKVSLCIYNGRKGCSEGGQEMTIPQ